jgi:dinuclear metal center YbgI/SA1388 family protein
LLLSELVAKFETLWPSQNADEWDRVGLTLGSPEADVRRVLFAVDLTNAVVDEAITKNCDLIVTHHPLLLKGVNSLADSELKGSLVSRMIRSGISLFTAHTNADVSAGGASTLMAERFGLTNLMPLIPSPHAFGHGVIGNLNDTHSLASFAKRVSSSLTDVARKVSFAGQADKPITRVAICSGAGDSFLPNALASDADVFVTSDLRHHVVLDALETPRPNGQLALIDVSHWAAESLWVSSAVNHLSHFGDLEAIASEVVTDPWTEEVL